MPNLSISYTDNETTLAFKRIYQTLEAEPEIVDAKKLPSDKTKKIISHVIAATGSQYYGDVNQYVYNRGFVPVFMEHGVFSLYQNQEDAIDEHFRFYETRNAMGHCSYITTGLILLLEMIMDPVVHRRVVNMFKILRQDIDSVYRGDKTGNDVYNVYSGLLRMYMSTHFDENVLATEQEV